MEPVLFLTAGSTKALTYAQALLGQAFSFTGSASAAVTHLLLPVPSFESDGSIKGGGDLQKLLAQLPGNITVVGGNLNHPVLQGYRVFDLLQDPMYLAKNARITAHCAIALAAAQLERTWDDVKILIVGWGRIGKCLAHLLQALGTDVTVAARKETDRATLASLGIKTVPTDKMQPSKYDVIINTAPEMILPHCEGKGLKIDLASKPGIGGRDVIWARGLPNKHAPESSGRLIAETVTSYLSESEAIV